MTTIASEVACRIAPAAPDRGRDPALGVALSGGGFRAMLYHVGALRRLNELGLLAVASRFSSVSGGSITAALLGLTWDRLRFDGTGVSDNLVDVVETPLFELAGRLIDIWSVLGGLGSLRSPAQALSGHYARHLFGSATLQDLPESPRFTLNTTNMVTGTLMRWAREYAADYRVGTIFEPTTALADVVAASSAFPPFLSPMKLRVSQPLVDHRSRVPVDAPPKRLWLTDGGVYDNLGLQAVESFHTVLVSDGGAPFDSAGKLRANWLSQSLRTVDVIDRQVRALRRRRLLAEFTDGQRLGSLWTIATPVGRYGLADAIPVSDVTVRRLAAVPTRLAPISVRLRKQLVNWGYVSADCGVRAYVEPSFSPPTGLPFPDEPLGS